MKKSHGMKYTLFVFVVALFLQRPVAAQGVGAAAAEPQVWRAYGGHSVTADFVEIKAGTVVLKGEDGTVRQVPLHLLVPEDQARAKQLDELKRTAPAHAFAKGAAGKLALFSDGPAKGSFAVYTHENFVAKLGADAVLRVQCLEAGKAVGNPIQVYLWGGFRDPKAANAKRRTIVSFKEDYKPMIQPDRIYLEGVMSEDVLFGVGFEFKGSTIQSWGWVEDPKTIKFPTLGFPVCDFSRSHSFPADLLVVEQKKILEPFSLKVQPQSGKPVIHPYGDRVKGFNQPAKTVEILGPVFGGRKVSLALGSSKACELRAWKRNASPPFEGFEVRMLKEKKESRDETSRMILAID